MAWAEEGWELPPCDLVIDAIIGYGLRGDPRGKARDLIQLANSSVAPILSLDTPSGLDTESGHLFLPHIRAAATLTLALPKRGLVLFPGRAAAGHVRVADIGIPEDVLESGEGLRVELPDPLDVAIRLPRRNEARRRAGISRGNKLDFKTCLFKKAQMPGNDQ